MSFTVTFKGLPPKYRASPSTTHLPQRSTFPTTAPTGDQAFERYLRVKAYYHLELKSTKIWPPFPCCVIHFAHKHKLRDYLSFELVEVPLLKHLSQNIQLFSEVNIFPVPLITCLLALSCRVSHDV